MTYIEVFVPEIMPQVNKALSDFNTAMIILEQQPVEFAEAQGTKQDMKANVALLNTVSECESDKMTMDVEDYNRLKEIVEKY